MKALNTTYSSIFELTTAQSEFGLPDCGDGYKVWIIRITNEALGFNKPEVLFIGGHHGNEDVSIETPYYFAEWLTTSYDVDEHVRYLIDNREIYIMPVINPWGWENNVREDINGEDPNRDYPYANTSYNQALTTVGARAVHELMKRHMFISALSWHSGLQGIYYAWGTPVHDTPTDEAPDTVAFYEQARLMSAKGGNYGGKYSFGPANEEIFGVRGAWSDYAYAAAWDTQYTAPEFPTNGSRSLAIGVEISNIYAPPENELGNSDGIDDPGGDNDGWIPKNIRMALVLLDTAEPYINWREDAGIPSVAYPGQNITLEWEVMGAFKADETRVNYEYNWTGSDPATIDQNQTSVQEGWSGWYGNTFSEQITMPQEPGDYYFVASAIVDQSTLEQTIPEPDVEPQSFYVNQRTNESWEISNNGNSMKGQTVWYSDVIHIEVQVFHFVDITYHPQEAEINSLIRLNWTVGFNSDYDAVNQTQLLWGVDPDPLIYYDFVEIGILVGNQTIGSNAIYDFHVYLTTPFDPGRYYFVVKCILDDIQYPGRKFGIRSEVVEIEVVMPPGGLNLNVTTPIVDYTGNLIQQIDITKVDVACPDLGLDICDDEMLNVHEYHIFNYDKVQVKTGNLNWNGDNWQALNINVSALPEHLYYVTCYFEHDKGKGSNNHTEGDSSEFYVDHILIISQPVLEIFDSKMRFINITNITIVNSYQYPPEHDYTNITPFEYIIENFTNHWKPIMLGKLNYTDGQWQALNINLSKYGIGEYRVNLFCYYAYHYQEFTLDFNFTYTENIEDLDEDKKDSEPDDISIYFIAPIFIIILILIIINFLHKGDKKRKKIPPPRHFYTKSRK